MGGRLQWARAVRAVVMTYRTEQRSPHWGRSGICPGQQLSSGEGRTMRDPELVARAQHAAARLESAWERWRSLQGIADTPAQPVVGYVGCTLKEPWGQPRAVIGFSADEAERLAEHLESVTVKATPRDPDSGAQPVQRPLRNPCKTVSAEVFFRAHERLGSGRPGPGPSPDFSRRLQPRGGRDL